MFNAGLVLEGGGMRGAYTAGVLDYWMEQGVAFERIYGVSAGAIQACSFMSGQKGRGFACFADYLDDWRYVSLRSLLTTGDMFGVKMCYDTIPNELYPFDYSAFEANPTRLYAAMTNVSTGKAEYRPIEDMHRDTIAIRASGTLPFISRTVKVDGQKYLDGGIADSIPLQRALEDGFERTVVVLTQDESYQKKPSSMGRMAALRYPLRPQLRKQMETRHTRYNQQTAFVKQMEQEGRAFVVRPQSPVTIARMEKDREKLKALYRQGREDARRLYSDMVTFLSAKDC